MKSINIARTLVAKRREKGITQDELAKFIGVSTPAVSKWESGQSYPDITFLPQLAAYFDISVDELIAYEPQMTDDDVRKLYEELSSEFATKPLDDVVSRCRDITKKYYSCFPLLFQIGVLLLNYGATSKDEEKRISVITEAKELFVRVNALCDSLELKQIAFHSEAVCEMMLGNSNEVIALLEKEKRHIAIPSIGAMLSQSYQMLGKMQEAKVTLQGSLLDSIILFFYDITPYLAVCSDDVDHFEEVCRRATQMIEVFKMKELNPECILPFYLAAATGYLANGKTEKALAMLETYTEIATGDIFPLTVRADNFFTVADKLIELPFGMSESLRDERSLKQDMVDDLISNPAFLILADEPRYKVLVEKLNTAFGK